MRRSWTYILMLVLCGAVITLFLASKKKSSKVLDERLTLKKNDRLPYGSWAVYNSLPYVFPKANISLNKYEPGYWESLSNYEEKQVLFILTGRFTPSKEELIRTMRFAENGNHVFIIAQYLSGTADEFFNCNSSAFNINSEKFRQLRLGMKLKLRSPPFDSTKIYGYPGRAFESYFSSIDTATTEVLGVDAAGRSNFVRLQAGKGFVYLHLEPLAFSNYFLLHGENTGYFEELMALLPADAPEVVWDEYYISNRDYREPEQKKNWFRVLMNMENEEGTHSFRAAFLLLIAMLLVYVFMEMRRKQRIIPVYAKPRNDSLDFVKTIGRLYYDKGDHKNLSRKMGAYFLEHVRNRYKLPTSELGEDFVKTLSYKTGVPETEINGIIQFIRYAEEAYLVGEKDLMEFHRKLQSFYLKA